jgi:hypothetical protein
MPQHCLAGLAGFKFLGIVDTTLPRNEAVSRLYEGLGTVPLHNKSACSIDGVFGGLG